jgi:hypothetical protein
MPPENVTAPQQLEEHTVLPKNTSKIRTATKKFIVKPANWLGKSTYSNQLFSVKWGDQEADGSYFIDSDEATFEIILKYLRSAVLPVFYDSVKGHDFSLYDQVLQEPRYFGIDRLCKCIKEAKYIDAIKVAVVYADTDSFQRSKQDLSVPDRSVLDFVSRWSYKTAISSRSNMEVTTAAFPQTRNSLTLKDAEAHVIRYHTTRKEVTYDHDLCVNAYPELK